MDVGRCGSSKERQRSVFQAVQPPKSSEAGLAFLIYYREMHTCNPSSK